MFRIRKYARTILIIAGGSVSAYGIGLTLLGAQMTPGSLTVVMGASLTTVALVVVRRNLALARLLVGVGLTAMTFAFFLPQIRTLQLAAGYAEVTLMRGVSSSNTNCFRAIVPRAYQPFTRCRIHSLNDPSKLEHALQRISHLPLEWLEVRSHPDPNAWRCDPQLRFFKRDVRNIALTRRMTTAIARMKSLQLLIMTGFETRGDEIKDFANLKDLKYLILTDCRLSDEGWEALSDLKEVEEICLGGNITVGDRAIESLAKLPSLKSIQLYCTRVSIEGLRHFEKGNADLRRLSLSFSPYLAQSDASEVHWLFPNTHVEFVRTTPDGSDKVWGINRLNARR